MMKRSISTSTRLDSQFMPPNLTGRSSSHCGASAAWAAPVNAKTTAAAARVLTGVKRIGFCLHRFRDTTHAGGLRYAVEDRKSTRLNSSHVKSSYAVFCLKKK